MDWLDSYRVVGRMALEKKQRTYSGRILARENAVAVRDEFRAIERPYLQPKQRSRFTVTTEREVQKRQIDDAWKDAQPIFHEINPSEEMNK